jgi:opacity protein-like surface antigen
MKAQGTVLLVGLVALLAVPLQAQTPLSLEVRAGMGVPVGDFAEDNSPGIGLGGNLIYRMTPMIDLYAGYSWQQFGEQTEWEWDGTVQWSSSGFAAGARLHLLDMTGVRPWIGAGVIAKQLSLRVTWDDELEGPSSGTTTETTDYSIGFEVEAGLELPVGSRFSLTPAVGFRRYTPSKGEWAAASAVSYVGVHLGGRLSL